MLFVGHRFDIVFDVSLIIIVKGDKKFKKPRKLSENTYALFSNIVICNIVHCGVIL